MEKWHIKKSLNFIDEIKVRDCTEAENDKLAVFVGEFPKHWVYESENTSNAYGIIHCLDVENCSVRITQKGKTFLIKEFGNIFPEFNIKSVKFYSENSDNIFEIYMFGITTTNDERYYVVNQWYEEA